MNPLNDFGNATIYVYHEDGHYAERSFSRRSYDTLTARYDRFQGWVSPYRDIVYWNRVYRIGNNRPTVVPDHIVVWKQGDATEYKYNKVVMSFVNKILSWIPRKWAVRHKRWRWLKC